MKVFVKGTTYLAEPGSYFKDSVKIDGDFIVPPKTQFWKDLVVSGHLSLGVGSRVGNVLLRPGIVSDEVHGENILVMGKIHCGKLMGRNTRVVTN